MGNRNRAHDQPRGDPVWYVYNLVQAHVDLTTRDGLLAEYAARFKLSQQQLDRVVTKLAELDARRVERAARPPKVEPAWKSEPATVKQVEALERELGIKITRPLTKGDAGRHLYRIKTVKAEYRDRDDLFSEKFGSDMIEEVLDEVRSRLT